MKIQLNQRVKHDGRTYEVGDSVTVSEALAEYFCISGWASCIDGESPKAEPPPKNATLDVQNGVLGHTADNVSGSQ